MQPVYAKKQKITGTKEWATKTINIQYGCENNCRYCYAKKMHSRFNRIPIGGWEHPELKPQNEIFQNLPRDTTVMFPSTHDITENNIEICIDLIRKLLEKRNKILIVSKPRIKCIKEICKTFQEVNDKIEFRFTIGSWYNEKLKYFEPNASSVEARFDCIQFALEYKFKVSISCEPLLDEIQYSIADYFRMYSGNIPLIERLLQFTVEEIWIGAMNYSQEAPKLDYEAIYRTYKDNSRIKWKDSFRKHLKIQEGI